MAVRRDRDLFEDPALADFEAPTSRRRKRWPDSEARRGDSDDPVGPAKSSARRRPDAEAR